jgi:hypothetical protein
MNQKYFKNISFLFFWGARPGSALGCLKKATQIPKTGHPISANFYCHTPRFNNTHTRLNTDIYTFRRTLCNFFGPNSIAKIINTQVSLRSTITRLLSKKNSISAGGLVVW